MLVCIYLELTVYNCTVLKLHRIRHGLCGSNKLQAMSLVSGRRRHSSDVDRSFCNSNLRNMFGVSTHTPDLVNGIMEWAA